MEWTEEEKYLTERLEILLELRKKFGEEVIRIASQARLSTHQRWLVELSKKNPPIRPAEAFFHSAYSVTTGDSDHLEFEVVEDSEKRFAVKITNCRYADFFKEQGFPEIGYALHCVLDFGEVEAFCPNITLKRSKTLMQGDEYCNHCYEMKEKKVST